MGIENRDYYRDSSYTERLSGWSFDAIPPACKWIIIINVVVFLLQIFVTRQPAEADIEAFKRRFKEEYKDVYKDLSEEELTDHVHSMLPRVSVVQEWLQLETPKVIRGQVWRLVTCAFCHDYSGIWHLLLNMLCLYWFARTLELMYGSREFVLFYLAAAIAASLAYVGLDLATGGATPAIGASGAVMAVFMVYAIYYPRSIIYVMYFIPIEVRWLVVLYVIFDLHPVLLTLAGHEMHTGIAHAAHLGGLAFGFIYWRTNLRLEPYFEWLRSPRFDRVIGRRRNVRMYRPGPKDSATIPDALVDEILKKIHEHGEASLTPREREILADASKRYQKRNR